MEGHFQDFCDHFFDVFSGSVFKRIVSHFGVVFGAFLGYFLQLVSPLRGNVHLSKIVTPLSVLLGF